jgi:DNA-binding transcriptional LysR family regulator
VRRFKLYTERYILLRQASGRQKDCDAISWAEAATHPLCLLTPDMQNRRILDMHFREAGTTAQPVIETNSMITLWSHLRSGRWSTVVPHTFLLLLSNMDGLTALRLVEPDASHAVGLVASEREPLPPLTRAFFDLAKKVDLNHEMSRQSGPVASVVAKFPVLD